MRSRPRTASTSNKPGLTAAPVTAIHTVNDYVALHVFAAARSLGVKIPEDLSVVGFDDIELASQVEPPLTTVRQDF